MDPVSSPPVSPHPPSSHPASSHLSHPAPSHPEPVVDSHLNDKLQAVGEIVLCSSVPTQLVIGALLRLAGLQSTDAAGNLSFPFVLTLTLTDTVVLIALMVALTRARGESAAALWLGRRPATRELLYGLLTVPLVFIGVGLLLNTLRLFAPWLHNVPTNPLEQLAATPGEAAMFALVAILAGGLREELQRAFLLRRFEQHLGGAMFGLIVLSVAFGLGHFVQGWDAVITTGVLGAVWGAIYLKRRSSVAPVVSHAAFNSLEIVRVAIGVA